MVEDDIRQEIVIASSPDKVWAVLTGPEHLGKWFGTGSPAEVDLRPGGRLVIDHGAHGSLHARIEKVNRPRLFSFRISQSKDGLEPAEGNATLVEFLLSPEDDGRTRLLVTETGFTSLTLPQDWVRERRTQNAANWPGKLVGLVRYCEPSP